MNEYMTVKQFTELLRLHENTVYRWIAAGMPHMRLGKTTIRINEREAMSWLKDYKGR